MIDATKLVDGGLYHVQYHYNVWTVGRWHASTERFTVIGSIIAYSLIELTAAIPMPTPEQLQADAKRLAELESDHAHALAETKRRLPDYPFTQNTMSECVWALGESLIGTERAIDDWHDLVKQMREVISDISKPEHDDPRLDYVTVQISRETYDLARKLLEQRT